MTEGLLKKIDDLIETVSMPLRADDLVSGWSRSSQAAMLKFFEDLRQRVLAGETLPYLGIIRGLDHWGISGGELFQKAAEVDYQLRNRPRDDH